MDFRGLKNLIIFAEYYNMMKMPFTEVYEKWLLGHNLLMAQTDIYGL